MSKNNQPICKTNEYGTKRWYLNGQIHREDAPAVEWIDGYKVWYYHGQLVNCSSQKEFERLIKLKALW